MGKSKFTSKSDKNYEISGNDKQGYSAKDLDNDCHSIWASDSCSGVEKTIREVESGIRQDVGDFGKNTG